MKKQGTELMQQRYDQNLSNPIVYNLQQPQQQQVKKTVETKVDTTNKSNSNSYETN